MNGKTTTIGTTTVHNDGTWTATVTLTGDGTHSISASDTDSNSNSATSAPVSITLDTEPPVVSITTANHTSNVATQTISGTVTSGEAPVGATVLLFDTINGNTSVIGSATVGSDGHWTTQVTLTEDGVHSISAGNTDSAGEVGTSPPVVITLDTAPPTVTINTQGTTTNQTTQTISGTVTTIEAAAGGTVTLFDTYNGVTTQIGTATLTGGNWSTNVTLSGNGAHSIVAQDTDTVGNVGSSSATVFTIANVAPTITITSPIAGDNTIDKAEADAGVTLSGTVTAGIGGAAVDGQAVIISVVDSSGNVAELIGTTVIGGTWSVNSSLFLPNLADGTYTLKANVTDAAGNAATTATQTLTLDETSPTIAITGPIAGDNIINHAEAAAGVTISGTVTSGPASILNDATVTIVDSSGNIKDTLTAAVSNGVWSVNLTATQAQGLADGAYTVKANISDTAGNVATTATQTISVDEAVPTVTITNPIAGDNTINKAEAAAGVTISGTATDGQVVDITVVDSAGNTKETIATSVNGGTWSVDSALFLSNLTDGTYTLKANITDAAGNAATTATQPFTLDTTAPTIAITSAGGTTSQSTQTIAGTVTTTEAAAGGTVVLFDTYNGVQAELGTATLSGGSWSATVTLSGSGTHSIVAQDTDLAGNTGGSSVVTYSLTVAANSWANQSGGNWTVGANWSSGSVPSSTANVTLGPIGATANYLVSIFPGTTVLANSLVLSDVWAQLVDEGTLSIAGTLSLVNGLFDIADGGNLTVGGGLSASTNEFIEFSGTGGNLVLNGTTNQTVQLLSNANGAISVSGSGNITTTSGDALDLTSSLGTSANPTNLTIGLTGAISGAANAINVVQSGTGNITIDTSGAVVGAAGDGIIAEQSSIGIGNVLVDATGSVTGTGAGTFGILAEILNASDTGNVSVELAGSIAGAGRYGIRALSDGTGDITVNTDPGSKITSGGTGISAINEDTAILATAGSTISVTAYGTINSGAVNNLNGSVPKGIDAGYYGASGTTNTAINGTVLIDNFATITAAAGDGIEGYNEGNGNITVTDEAGTTVSAALYGITAFGNGSGNINVTTLADTINSGSAGLNIYNQATSLPQVSGSDDEHHHRYDGRWTASLIRARCPRGQALAQPEFWRVTEAGRRPPRTATSTATSSSIIPPISLQPAATASVRTITATAM